MCKFYNLDRDPKWNGFDEGNYVDGDSNAAYAIIEITQELELKFYPLQRDYLGNVIEL